MKKRSPFFLSCLLCVNLFIGGCVATSGIPSVHAIRNQKENLSNKKTYSWYQERPVAGQMLESGYTIALNKHVQRAVEEELQEKGFRKVTANPDLLVAYDVSVSVPADKDIPSLYGPGFGYSYSYQLGYRYKYETTGIEGFRPVDLFKQGTLIVDLIDPASNKLIWRGWSEGAIADGPVRDNKSGYRKIKEMVEPVMSFLPAR